MRIWDVPVTSLCDRHLVAEHRELHCIYSVLRHGHKGYSNHPETRRWSGRLRALRTRHEDEAAEMLRRGMRHQSPMPIVADGDRYPDPLPGEGVEWQVTRLTEKTAEGRCKDRRGLVCAIRLKEKKRA